MVEAYWQMGKRIVEEEQHGEARAQYGTQLLQSLANELRQEFGKGFDARELRRIRQFYLTFPISGRTASRIELESLSTPDKGRREKSAAILPTRSGFK